MSDFWIGLLGIFAIAFNVGAAIAHGFADYPFMVGFHAALAVWSLYQVSEFYG